MFHSNPETLRNLYIWHPREKSSWMISDVINKQGLLHGGALGAPFPDLSHPWCGELQGGELTALNGLSGLGLRLCFQGPRQGLERASSWARKWTRCSRDSCPGSWSLWTGQCPDLEGKYWSQTTWAPILTSPPLQDLEQITSLPSAFSQL